MRASDIHDEQRGLARPPAKGDWLRIVGIAVAIVLVCAVWAFWN